jgi:hypothetical protein
MSVLESLPEFSGNEATFVPMNSDPMHMRFGQQIHGMNVEGVSLYVHVDEYGKLLGVNGEMVNGTSVPFEYPLTCTVAAPLPRSQLFVALMMERLTLHGLVHFATTFWEQTDFYIHSMIKSSPRLREIL